MLDVAELLPGHLRIFSLARGSSLYKRALMYYSSKSKSDRNSVSESIQESYKRLREVRKEMKEIQRVRAQTETTRLARSASRCRGLQLRAVLLLLQARWADVMSVVHGLRLV